MKSVTERLLRLITGFTVIALICLYQSVYAQSGTARVKIIIDQNGQNIDFDTLLNFTVDDIQLRVDSIIASFGLTLNGLPAAGSDENGPFNIQLNLDLNDSSENFAGAFPCQGSQIEIHSDTIIVGTDTIVTEVHNSVVSIDSMLEISVLHGGNLNSILSNVQSALAQFGSGISGDTIIIGNDTIIMSVPVQGPCHTFISSGMFPDSVHYVDNYTINGIVDSIFTNMDINVEGDSVFQKKVMRIEINDEPEGLESGSQRQISVMIVMVKMEDVGENKSANSGFQPPVNSKKPLAVEELSFYPNPGNGLFNLKFSLEKKADTEIVIHDGNGKKVYSNILRDFTGDYEGIIDLSENPKGVYYLTLEQGKKRLTKKLVIQ
jgi:hypothetical protein